MSRLAAALVFVLAGTPGVTTAEPGAFDSDGWYTWRVPAVDDSPQWCCMDWNGGRAQPVACDLDSGHGSFGSDDDRFPDTGELQLYVFVSGGEPVRMRALSPACPVTSREAPIDLGRVDAVTSLAWITPLADDEDAQAIAAIAAHRGSESLAFVSDVALHGQTAELREQSLFWLGQLRVSEGRATLLKVMFEDRDPDLREHAAFSFSQSEAPDRAEQLMRQGREDRDADVRSQAWFWLAQTGAPGSESALFDAMRTDPDPGVREDVVFALSELPDDRAVASLLRIVRDTGMKRDIRERALFWLVQSDSDEAYEVIDSLLSAGR